MTNDKMAEFAGPRSAHYDQAVQVITHSLVTEISISKYRKRLERLTLHEVNVLPKFL